MIRGPHKLDKTDKRILHRLQENARVTISALSEEVALSMPAISERLKKLESSGIIKQYTTIIDPVEIDKQLTAQVFVAFDNPVHGDNFREFVKHEPDIKECFYITGEYDYLIKVVTKNTISLEKLLNTIKTQPGMTKTQTLIVLSTVLDRPSLVIE